jgi:hypothetical protein
LLVVFVACAFYSLLENSCGNHQSKRKSSGNQCGISKWKLRKTEIQRGTQEIKVDFQIEIKGESSGFNKSKKKSKWNSKIFK